MPSLSPFLGPFSVSSAALAARASAVLRSSGVLLRLLRGGLEGSVNSAQLLDLLGEVSALRFNEYLLILELLCEALKLHLLSPELLAKGLQLHLRR